MNPITVTVSPSVLRAVMPAAANKELLSHYLNGVALYPHAQGGVVAVATDGHICAFAHDEKGTWESSSAPEDKQPLIIARAGTRWENGLLARIAKLKVGDFNDPATFVSSGISNNDNGVECSIAHAGSTMSMPAGRINGRYPDVSVFTKPQSNGEPSGFDPALMARAFECVAGSSLTLPSKKKGRSTNIVVMHMSGSEVAHVIGEVSRVCVVVMPLRSLHISTDLTKGDAPARQSTLIAGLEWLNNAFS